MNRWRIGEGISDFIGRIQSNSWDVEKSINWQKSILGHLWCANGFNVDYKKDSFLQRT
jgi:hypothetical protein